MKIKSFIIAILLCLCAGEAFAQEERWGQNNPYIDDGLFHWGFQIGMNFGSFLTDQAPANVSSPGVGFRVGFVTDLRLCKYLNLRFTPGLEFSYRSLTYTKDAVPPIIKGKDTICASTTVGAIPIVLPLYLKFSAEREANVRPYVLVGGGISVNVTGYDPNNDFVALKRLDYFCEAGFGCDIYFRWFKFCPEITYRIGFADQLDRNHMVTGREKYVTSFGTNRVINQAICLTFNFQD